MPSWKAILATPGSESLETWDCEEGIETNAASWCCVEITCRTFSDWDFWEGQCSQTNAVKMKCVIKLAWPLKTIPSVIPTLAPTVQTLQADCAQGNGKNKRRKYHAFKKKEEAAQQHSTNTRNPNPVGKPAQRCLCQCIDLHQLALEASWAFVHFQNHCQGPRCAQKEQTAQSWNG